MSTLLWSYIRWQSVQPNTFASPYKYQGEIAQGVIVRYDATIVADIESATQRITSCFAEAAQLFGLEICMKKTEVLHQLALHEEYHPPSIFTEQPEIKAVHQFSYLGCIITSDVKIDKEVDNWLAKTNSAFGGLYKRVWNNKNLKKDTKINVYKAIVQTTLLHGAESWVTYRRHLRLTERYHQRCRRTILNNHWSDFVTNTDVLVMAKVTSIEGMLLKTQLRWAGHVSSPGWKTIAYQRSYYMENCLLAIVTKIQRHFEKVPRHL